MENFAEVGKFRTSWKILAEVGEFKLTWQVVKFRIKNKHKLNFQISVDLFNLNGSFQIN